MSGWSKPSNGYSEEPGDRIRLIYFVHRIKNEITAESTQAYRTWYYLAAVVRTYLR